MSNTAKQRSINHGQEIKVGSTTYFGSNPEYVQVGFMTVKTKKGIPYVNMDKLKKS